MKYVIFKTSGGVYMPVIIPQHVTHSQISIEGAAPVSAGFFIIRDERVVVFNDVSESLQLGPDTMRDPALLTNTLNNSGIYAFML